MQWFETVFSDSEQRHSVKAQRLALKAFGATGRRQKGEAVLAMMDSDSLAVRLAKIEYFGMCGDISLAQREFERIADPSTAALCVWMQCLLNDAQFEAALSVYDSMRDSVSHLLALRASTKQKNATALRRVKALYLKLSLEYEVLPLKLAASFLDCHARCGDVDAAEALFIATDDAQLSVVSVTAMMNAYALGGRHSETVRLFLQSFDDSESSSPANANPLTADIVAFRMALSSCSKLKGTLSVRERRRIHEMLERQSQSEILEEPAIRTHLIAMYADNGELETARTLFARWTESESEQSLAVWHSMASALSRAGCLAEAMSLFSRMLCGVGTAECCMQATAMRMTINAVVRVMCSLFLFIHL